jgi:hypothetical protein
MGYEETVTPGGGMDTPEPSTPGETPGGPGETPGEAPGGKSLF